jgi:predicted glycosyltransferase involved in capsule biosynthesis
VDTSARGHGVSLLVPFLSDNGRRQQAWHWLHRYWTAELPAVEIVVGRSSAVPFCKTAAVNDAARRAHGDVFVVLDADCYLDGMVVDECAANIRAARAAGERLWYMPYRHFYRLTSAASRYVMLHDPTHPPRFFAAPPPSMMLLGVPARTSLTVSDTEKAHWFGALIQVMPREAFELVGGMDERFSGWGGEDVSFLHALDTLYGKHKTTANGVIHLWHASIGTSVSDRRWEGQRGANANGVLCARYGKASGDVAAMRELVEEARGVQA